MKTLEEINKKIDELTDDIKVMKEGMVDDESIELLTEPVKEAEKQLKELQREKSELEKKANEEKEKPSTKKQEKEPEKETSKKSESKFNVGDKVFHEIFEEKGAITKVRKAGKEYKYTVEFSKDEGDWVECNEDEIRLIEPKQETKQEKSKEQKPKETGNTPKDIKSKIYSLTSKLSVLQDKVETLKSAIEDIMTEFESLKEDKDSLIKYRQEICIFRQFDPLKRFSNFSYEDLKWSEINSGYCNKEEILKIDGKYYIYAGKKYYDWNEKKPSIIRFKNRNKIIKEIEA